MTYIFTAICIPDFNKSLVTNNNIFTVDRSGTNLFCNSDIHESTVSNSSLGLGIAIKTRGTLITFPNLRMVTPLFCTSRKVNKFSMTIFSQTLKPPRAVPPTVSSCQPYYCLLMYNNCLWCHWSQSLIIEINFPERACIGHACIQCSI